jgi:plastocyanin
MRPPARERRTWGGARPIAALLLAVAGALATPLAASAAVLVISVQTPDGHALAGAVVTVRPLDGLSRRQSPVHAVMDQVDRAFVPDLLVIPVGSTVEFPNSDATSHQIYSFSPAKRFQLPLYRGKPYPPTHFDQAGLVTLGCNIHDEMLAYLLVTDAPWFGRTEATGSWTVEVPRGHYRVELWHPRARDEAAELTRELTVGEGDRADLTVRLGKSLETVRLANRAHSWD